MSQAASAAPTISQLSLRGLQIGGRTTIAISGTELLPEPRLLLSAPIVRQSVRPGATAQRVEFDVEIDPKADPGIYYLRLAGPAGVSNSVAIGLDRLPQAPMTAEVSQLPIALTGAVAGNNIASVRFSGRKGQALVVDVESRRLGARLNPVLHLYGERRVQVAWSQGIPAIANDPRLETVLPADGPYVIEVHDALYRGAEPGFFRLKVGDLRYADFVYPLAVQRGHEQSLSYVVTNFPSSATARIAPPGGDAAELNRQAAPWPQGFHLISGSRPRVLVGEFAEFVEPAEASSTPLAIPPAPLGINGRISKNSEVDRFLLPVTPGDRLRLDVLSDQIGSPLDGVLTVNNEQGLELAKSDDRRGTHDPGLEITVPENVSKLMVELRDLRATGGAAYIYRIEVKPLRRPDYRLTLFDDRYLVPNGASALMRMRADRDGYEGPIRLTMFGLPENMSATGLEIPAGAGETFVTLLAPRLELAQRMVTVVGDTGDETARLKRVAMVAENPVTRYQPWLRGELAVAVVPPSPLEIEWEPYSADTQLLVGTVLPAKVKIKRGGNLKGLVRLSLVTSQPAPKKTTIVAGKDVQQDDITRALRFDGNPTISPNESEEDLNIIVPGDLPLLPYDLAVRAEIRGADDQSVIASAVTPARRIVSNAPVMIELADAAKVEGRAGIGQAGVLTGKVHRRQKFQAPVKVTLTGLPENIAAPVAEVPMDADEFRLPVQLPFGTPAGKLEGVKLVATSQIDPNDHKSTVRSNEIPLEMTVAAGQKPPAVQPMRIFEDEPEFVANLTQGSGDAMLFYDERYSGTACVKLTTDQKFNPQLPGLAVKIRQHPGAGEYRYLRFAWRRQSGTACFQLAHDGTWGPTAGNAASFRYDAGGGPSCFGAALRVNRLAPQAFTAVTRDLFSDFGEFTLTGIALTSQGELALFDHIYLGKTPSDFELVQP